MVHGADNIDKIYKDISSRKVATIDLSALCTFMIKRNKNENIYLG